jgi:predicted alpha/beta-fold hydrolase
VNNEKEPNDRHGIESTPHASLLTPNTSLITPYPFRPSWWCRNAHFQTLWPTLARRRPVVSLRRERLELPDGDFVDLDWTTGNARGPIVILLHGLEGSSNSNYALGMLRAAEERGWRGTVMHFRNCSGEPNRLARSYHSGETGDIAFLIETLARREPKTPVAIVGYSLGGNVLLKWLGETGPTSIRVAVAVSVPFMLADCAARMERGFSRVYQWDLVRRLKHSIETKRRRMALPIHITDLSALRTFREFDEHITAPLHGFAGADDYYARSSSRQYLRRIAVPTLIVHGRDDPFMSEAAIPTADELSPAITFELYRHGGHVGFVSGVWPWRACYWLEKRIPDFLQPHLGNL